MTLSALSPVQLSGREDSHVVALPCGQRLQPTVAEAFARLRAGAREAGFELAIASGFRSFGHQLAIWNGKAAGERTVHDDRGSAVALEALDDEQRVHAILRFSALPGASRHHWGTEVDVYDAAALPAGERPGLTPGEVSPGGIFAPLHEWLDEQIAAGRSQGFYRPYAVDSGGVAPERWHLSYAPLALHCESLVTPALLRACWDAWEEYEPMLLREAVERDLPGLLRRFVQVPPGWAPL